MFKRNVARRHKCEICFEVFECALCRIERDKSTKRSLADHPMHSAGHRQGTLWPIFVCRTCIETGKHERFVRTDEGVWDYVTGDFQLHLFRVGRAKQNRRKASSVRERSPVLR